MGRRPREVGRRIGHGSSLAKMEGGLRDNVLQSIPRCQDVSILCTIFLENSGFIWIIARDYSPLLCSLFTLYTQLRLVATSQQYSSWYLSRSPSEGESQRSPSRVYVPTSVDRTKGVRTYLPTHVSAMPTYAYPGGAHVRILPYMSAPPVPCRAISVLQGRRDKAHCGRYM